MTVSLALNKPEKLSAQTRDLVLQTVRDMGYRPRAVRHKSRQDDPATLGVLNTDHLMTPGYLAAVLEGITERAYALDQNLLLFPAHRWKADPLYNVRVNCDGRCDGMIFMATPPGDAIMCLMRERGAPVVMIGLCSDEGGVAGVDVDNFGEGLRVTEYLIGLGHRRIGFLACRYGYGSARLRGEGYRQALSQHGLPANPAWIAEGLRSYEQTYEVAREILSRPASERPTAIFAWNDGWALQTLRAATDLGLRVPEDLAIVGFDDSREAAASSPSLTTVRQPYTALGARAVDLLLAQIRGGGVEKAVLPGELVVRQSTGPPSIP